MKREEAEQIAVAALGALAADPVLLPRFLAISGIEAQNIRAAAAEPGFLAGVLDFVLAHEPTLTGVAASLSIPPESLTKARRALPNGDDRYETST